MSQIPEAAIRSAAEFVRDWAKHQRHTEGIGDCCHCNGNFLASWAENLLKDCSALEEQIQHTETNLQLSREHAEQMAAKLNDQEAELSRLEAQVEALQRENERLKSFSQPNPEEFYEEGRCQVCGWPLSVSMQHGCTKESCSYRPRDGSPEWYRLDARRKWLATQPAPQEPK